MTHNEKLAYALLEYASILKEETLDESIHGRTKSDYAKKKFKEKYKYDPKDKTIEVDGKKHRIRIEGEDKDKDTEIKGIIDREIPSYQRQTGANLTNKRGGIYLDKNYWKLKNQKRRDAILAHEIGHLKAHGINSKSKHLDRELVTKDNVDHSDDMYGSTRSGIENTRRLSEIEKKNRDSQRNKDRRDNIEKFKKYDRSGINSHVNVKEFEADRYASNKYGSKNIKKGVAETSKRSINSLNADLKKDLNQAISSGVSKKEIEKMYGGDIVKKYSKEMNKAAELDMKQRGKALKDKSIKSDVYK